MTNEELEQFREEVRIMIRKEVEKRWLEIKDAAWEKVFEEGGFGKITYTTGDTAMVCPICNAYTGGQPHACGGAV
jgi:hypothetical protein